MTAFMCAKLREIPPPSPYPHKASQRAPERRHGAANSLILSSGRVSGRVSKACPELVEGDGGDGPSIRAAPG